MMKLRTKFILLLLANLAVSQLTMQTAQADASSNPGEDERAFISIYHKWNQAYLAGDADSIDSIMSPDFILTNVRGEVSKKADEVAEVRNGAIHYDKFETSDLNVRVYGNVAVVTGRSTINGTVKKSGRVIDAQIRFTDTFVRQKNGKWQVVAGQTTLIPSEPPPSSQRSSQGKSDPVEVHDSSAGAVSATDGRHDFDFLFTGRWKVHNRRLTRRLEGSTEWQEFQAAWETRPLLSGLGNIDYFTATFPNGKPIDALTLRFFDPKSQEWSIYWIDNWTCQLQPPVVGRFVGDRGEFNGDDTFKGRPIKVRFTWVKKSPDLAHWEQAFSEDGGKTWETNWNMEITRETGVTPQTCCPIIELRQYTLHPGMRDTLIDLFDREFVESQEALGMKVIGQFRDMGNPNRFVWLRGFRDMTARAEALKSFYGGPVWKAHREAANATMIDSDNVLLLRPARPTSGFSLENSERPAPGATEIPKGLVVATIYYFNGPPEADFVDFFERALKPVLKDTGASILAYFMTESSANTFPTLPVREGEHVFVWFSRFRDEAAYDNYAAALARSPLWRGEVAEELARRLKGPPEVLKLSPTARSQLRG